MDYWSTEYKSQFIWKGGENAMKKCKSCKSDIDAKASRCPHCQADQRGWFRRHPIWTIILIVVVIGIISSAASGGSKTSTANNNSSSTETNTQTEQPTIAPTAAVRQVKGTVTTLGAGTFSGGKDVPVGLYDVTTTQGQSGNFIVSGPDSSNEILGQNSMGGVSKVRAQISDGDQIQISGLSSVTFTPVSAPFVTTHTPVMLYAGIFTVGQDIGAGRYVATTTPGSSGNFIVSGNDSVNEILGQNGFGGVPSVTTDLSDGDVITISGLESVTMTPAN